MCRDRMPGKGVRSLASCPACACKAAGAGVAQAKQPLGGTVPEDDYSRKRDKGDVKRSYKIDTENFQRGESVYFCGFISVSYDFIGQNMNEQYLINAIDAALQAGEQILKVYHDPAADFQVEQKADHSPLTLADRRAHEVIAGLLKRQTPYPLLSEEGKLTPYAERAAWTDLWIVDPLDGTKEFIKRNGEFTVNIALVHRGVPVMGVIYVPVKRCLYFASEGLGAFKLEDIVSLDSESLPQLMERALRLPAREERGKFVVVASRSHSTPETEAYIAQMRRQHAEVELCSSGSSLKICLVAEGKADVYPRFAPTMEWDTAAGHAIVRAAGGDIWQTDGSAPLHYNKEDLHNPWFIVLPGGQACID